MESMIGMVGYVVSVVILCATTLALYWSWTITTGMKNAVNAIAMIPNIPLWWLTRPEKAAKWIFRHTFQRDKVRAKKIQRERGRKHEDERQAQMRRAIEVTMDLLPLLVVVAIWHMIAAPATANGVGAMFALLGVMMFVMLQLYRKKMRTDSRSLTSAICTAIKQVPQLQLRWPGTSSKVQAPIKCEDLVTVYCPVQSAVIVNMLTQINRPPMSKLAYQELKRAGFNHYLQNSMNSVIANYKSRHKIRKLKKGHIQMILLHTVVAVVQGTLKTFAENLGVDEDDISDTGAAAGSSFTVELANVDTDEGKAELQKKLLDSVMLLDVGAKEFVGSTICKVMTGVRLPKKGDSMFVPLQFLFNMEGDRGLFLFYALYFEQGNVHLLPGSMASAWSMTHFSAGTLKQVTRAWKFDEIHIDEGTSGSHRTTPRALGSPALGGSA